MPTGTFDRGPGSRWYKSIQRRRARTGGDLVGQMRRANAANRTPEPAPAAPTAQPREADHHAPATRRGPSRDIIPPATKFVRDWTYEWTRR